MDGEDTVEAGADEDDDGADDDGEDDDRVLAGEAKSGAKEPSAALSAGNCPMSFWTL